MSYLLIEESLYSMCGAVICLITIPNVEGSGEFGGNFHNHHGSYLNWTCIPWKIWHLEFNQMSSSILRQGQTRLSRTGHPCPNDSKDG